MQDDYYDEDENEIELVSKSQLKREMTALQELGKKLIGLKDQQLAEVPLSDELLRAVKESRNITQREATRRHLQFIGKLMRDQDSEAIQFAIDKFDSSSQRFAQEMHELEEWRNKMVANPTNSVTAYIEEYPETDIQHLRQLIRNAVKDHTNKKNTGAGKKLFQYLKENKQHHDS